MTKKRCDGPISQTAGRAAHWAIGLALLTDGAALGRQLLQATLRLIRMLYQRTVQVTSGATRTLGGACSVVVSDLPPRFATDASRSRELRPVLALCSPDSTTGAATTAVVRHGGLHATSQLPHRYMLASQSPSGAEAASARRSGKESCAQQQGRIRTGLV